MEEGTSSIDGTPCTQRLSLREFQKCIARHVYTTGNEFHTLKFDGFQDIIKHIDGHEAYEIPTSDDLNGWLLKEIGKEMENYVAEIKNSWKSTGCSILLDGWIDGNGRNLMSVLVGSPKGTLYLKSADISSSDSQNLQKLFEEVLVDVGVENVVQVISYSTSPIMKEIGKNLVDKYRSFFWTVSGSYCIELMLEKFASMDLVGDVLEKAKMITRFVHGHESVLKLLRDQSSIHCLVKPSINRSAVPFLTLQNMLLEKAALDELFQSSVLKSSNWASKEEGKKIVKLVADCSFWERALLVLKAAIPLVKVLEWMNGDDDHLGNIYETIDQAKETIREQLKDTTLDHIPFWEVIDDIWNKCLHSPLHATGYFLHPGLFYTEDFSSHPEVTVGLLSCSVLMSKDHGSLHGLSMQFDEYQRGSGAFQQGSSDLSNISPVSWWLKYGEQYPELQRLAVRILGQKCSGASKYQLQRSMAERLLSGSGNGNQMIRRRQAKKLAFIHYNLHLQKFKSDVANKISIHEMKGIDDWTGENTQHQASSGNGLTSMDLDKLSK